MSFRLRIPIQLPAGRHLHVLTYGRYSTDEQHPSSNNDQFAYCKGFLNDNGVKDADFKELSDAELSGELVSRPGINKVRELIAARWPDLYIAEDCGRLFRNETACGQHIESAVDQGIRVIAINDGVDTAEDGWEDRLYEAMRHHARSNKYTAQRIRRKLEGLWRLGAAIGLLRPGYKRRPSVLASEHAPSEGPYYDEIDPRWEKVIYEAFERSANKEPPWLIAKWLTPQGLPKCGNAQTMDWTDRNTIDLIRRKLYRGLDTYRFEIVRKHHGSGKHLLVRNDPDKVLQREMAHLRIVPDWLWHAANEAIDERALCKPGPCGLDHPLTGIPRDSRGPLSGVLFCGICQRKMYKEGKVDASYRSAYRCAGAVSGDCWNKATALQSVVHGEIGKAIIAKISSLDGILDAIVMHVQDLFQNDEPRKSERARLVKSIHEGEVSCQRLLDAIEQAKEAPALLMDRLRQRNEEVASLKAKVERLDVQSNSLTPPTKQQILEKIETTAKRLLTMDVEAGVALKSLVSPIRAVPHQQFRGNKVVLRAQFDLHLATFLPEAIAAALQGTYGGPVADHHLVIPMTVDLFKPSAGPLHFAKALALSKAGMILEEIGRHLGIAKRQAHIAVQFGRDLESAGLTDPFVELTDPPTAASRWRRHPKLG